MIELGDGVVFCECGHGHHEHIFLYVCSTGTRTASACNKCLCENFEADPIEDDFEEDESA